MNFTPIKFKDELIGHEYRGNGFIFFFGTERGTDPLIHTYYKELKFYKLKQVHGDALVDGSESAPTADAHWTTQTSVGLRVSTADCLPVLIVHPKYCCAIHAGWRGIKNEIVLKSLTSLANKFGDSANLKVAYGPHIHVESFEVELSLAHDFQRQCEKYASGYSVISQHANPKLKAYINLATLLQLQLATAHVQPENIFEFSANTFTDLSFSSFRRQKSSSTRNFSFVARL